MNTRTAIGIAITAVLTIHLWGCGHQQAAPTKSSSTPGAAAQTGTESADSSGAQSLITAVYNGSPSAIEQQSGGKMQRECKTWVPAVGKALSRQFGQIKSVSLISSANPGEGWLEQEWSVQAEKGNYQMRTAYLSGELRHLEFRTASSQPWTSFAEIAEGQAIR